MNNEEISEVRTLSGMNFILGAWLAISPYVLNYTSGTAKWDQTVFGLIILILSAIRYAAPRFEWADWLNGLAGLWMVVAPFILSYNNGGATYWNEVIVGAVVAILAFWDSTIHAQPYTHSRA